LPARNPIAPRAIAVSPPLVALKARHPRQIPRLPHAATTAPRGAASARRARSAELYVVPGVHAGGVFRIGRGGQTYRARSATEARSDDHQRSEDRPVPERGPCDGAGADAPPGGTDRNGAARDVPRGPRTPSD